ncbi:MAG TPA: hypothetical protein VHE78_07660 [Gemmatimonadaceae bacterium]|nr:hypothetical protein [Gemmatimonadaceae bacterium]
MVHQALNRRIIAAHTRRMYELRLLAALALAATFGSSCKKDATAPGPLGTITLATIAVTPSTATLATGATQQFTAVGKDAAGNVVPITPEWSLPGGGGIISATGLFTAGPTAAVFPNAVGAASGNISGTATVS